MFYFNNIQNKELMDYINNLIDKKMYDEALELCNKEEYKNSREVKCQIIRILKKQNKLNDALILCDEYENDKNFIFQKIDILIKKNQLQQALELCEIHNYDEYFESQKMTVFIRKGRLEEALKICDKYPNSIFIQCQKVTILIMLNKLEEALEICNRFSKEEAIQSQKITILIKQNKLYSALEVCDKFPNYKFIQCQKVTILIMLNKLEEALQICQREEYLNDKYFIKKIRRIEAKKASKYMEENKSDFGINLSNDILLKIYSGTISLDEIKEESEWKQLILTIAYYEKNNKQKGIELIKSYKNRDDLSNEQIKILNILFNRLIIKKILIFDPTIYSEYLEQNFEDEKIINPIDNNSIVETNSKQEILIEDKKVETKKAINKLTEDRNTNNLLIKDLFKNEVLEVGKYLYVQMRDTNIRTDAIQAWDNFQILINKSVSDKEALNRMITFLRRIENSSSVKINLNEKKYAKYINI